MHFSSAFQSFQILMTNESGKLPVGIDFDNKYQIPDSEHPVALIVGCAPLNAIFLQKAEESGISAIS